MVAVINNFGGFYSTELYFQELKKAGAELHAPCMNESGYKTSVKGSDVWAGFIHVQGLEQAVVEQLIEERKVSGPFGHLQDFIVRLYPGIEQLKILIQTGAFRFTGKSKKELMWQANFLQKKSRQHKTDNTLFAEEPVKFQLPVLEQHPLDDALDEIELLGYSLGNVFDLVEEDKERYTPARELHRYLGKEVTVLGC
jgi:DNA polymerase-3 subunit alpha